MIKRVIAFAAALTLFCVACNHASKSKTKDNLVYQSDETVGQNVQALVPAPPPVPKSPPFKLVPPQERSEELIIRSLSQEGVKDESMLAPPVIDKGSQIVETKPLEDENKVFKKIYQFNTEDYNNIVENQFTSPLQSPLSTFSIDVDRASYSNVRRFLQGGSLPPAGAVRIEEMVNYFDYNYPAPIGNTPFSIITETAACPWNETHKLIHIGLKGKEIPLDNLPPSNLVFLVDVSGSMDEWNKLPLVKTSLKMLANQLRENDRVAIVVYAGNAGLVLPSTSGINKAKIKEAIDNLEAGGSTAGGEGIELAYKTASENFIKGGNNRVVLATDGDFNVGASSDDEMVRLIEKERANGIFLSVLGYGTGNYKDNKMQLLADKGNGNHAYIDNQNEATKVLVKEFGSTFFTIAKDVKIQVEFNPALVQAYRLVGYENRMLAAEDFNDDKKDAGEIGSGHTVTALYEIIPVGVRDSFLRSVDSLKYTLPLKATASNTTELMTIKFRYKAPDEEKSSLLVQTVSNEQRPLTATSENFRFSAAVAEFGLLLRNSSFKQRSDFGNVIALAKAAKGQDADGYRNEFIGLVDAAAKLSAK